MKKNLKKNKRAFTLTELLIVVIVIGVLSAVTLPKFTRVIENRKVTEAEEMMSAVRTEQERRCAMDKKYTLNFANLSDVVSSSDTKNYTYSLQAEGVSATSKKGNYTLKMLSYHNGSFCCTGADCAKLNKNYPSCDGLTFPSSGCEGSDGDGNGVGTDPTPSASCTDGQVRGSQVCNTCGVQTTQACVGGRWVSQLGECSKTVAECVPPETAECTDGAVRGSQSCNGCGTQTTQKCVSGKWVSQLGACSKTAAECEPKCEGPQPADQIKNCECGMVKASYSCSAATNYKWVLGAFPACPEKPQTETLTCPDGKTKLTKTYVCINGQWKPSLDKECPKTYVWSCKDVGHPSTSACQVSCVGGGYSTGASCSTPGKECRLQRDASDSFGNPNVKKYQCYSCTCIEGTPTTSTGSSTGGGGSQDDIIKPWIPGGNSGGSGSVDKFDTTLNNGYAPFNP